MDVYLMKVRFT